MTNEKIRRIALLQSARDCHCEPTDFERTEHLITRSVSHPGARKYLPLPFDCDMVSYGSNVVAQTSEALAPVAAEYLSRFSASLAFETPQIHTLDQLLAPHGLKTCFMAEYFLPDVRRLEAVPCCPYPLRLLRPENFSNLYLPEWRNALCKRRPDLDVFAVGAYDGDRLIGLAGASADCDTMYQIGVDVLPPYRRQGVAAALTGRLAQEILSLGKAPFYCAAWCNLPSVRNAVRSGFVPAWTELTARKHGFADVMNQEFSEKCAVFSEDF